MAEKTYPYVAGCNWLPVLLLGGLLALAGCGRDAGSAGGEEPFDLLRLASGGEPYEGTGHYPADPWACVLDRKTGLAWEVKTVSDGLHAASNTYTWYSPDPDLSERERGTPDGGECAGGDCDISAYVEAVNERGLCGFSDWRLPERGELATLNDPRIDPPGPTLATAYFPNTRPDGYWSGSAYGLHYTGAWLWDFGYGFDRVDWKSNKHHVRLVRGRLDPRRREPPDDRR